MSIDDRAARTTAVPTSTSSARRAWAVTVVAAGSAVVIFLDKALLGLVAGPIIDDLGLSATQFGAISSASYVLNVITCLLVGFAANRISPRLALLACGLMWAVGQVPAALATTGALLVVSRLAVGAAEGPAVPLAHTTAYSWFPNERRGVPAAVITSGAAAAKIALLPFLALLVVALGWRAGFVAVGALALLWCAAWAVSGRIGPFAAGQEGAARAPRLRWREVLLTRTALACLFAIFAQGGLAAVIFTWLPSYFEHGLGFSAAASGTLYALPSVMGIVALFTVGALGDRLLRHGVSSRTARGRIGGLCLVGSGLVLTVLPWVHVPVLAIAILMLGYGFSVTVNTSTFPVIAEIVPPAGRAGALAVLTAFSAGAGILSPLVAGMLLDAAATPEAGYTAAFLVFGGLVALGGLGFAAFVDPERDRQPSIPNT
jgi:MFS family permease